MKEFILIFRDAAMPAAERPTADQLKNVSQPWIDWIGGIAAQNKLVSTGGRLDFDGATVRPGNVVTDGPYAEIKEILLGYTIIRAENQEEAIQLSKSCPILAIGGNVEVRALVQMNS